MTPCLKVIVTNISEDLAVSVFRVELVFLNSTLKMDTNGSSDWVLIIYQSTRRNTPEDMQLHVLIYTGIKMNASIHKSVLSCHSARSATGIG